MIINKYLNFLNEKDKQEKIHPKLKSAVSWFAVSPASDVVVAGAGAGSAFKSGLKKGLTRSAITRNIVSHSTKSFLMGLGAFTGYRFLRSWLDKCEKECGREEINNPKRQLCKLECKKSVIQKTINQLKIDSSKIKDVNKVEKIKQKISNLQNKLIKMNKKIFLYKKYLNKTED